MNHHEIRQFIVNHVQSKTKPFSLAGILDEIRSQGVRVSENHVRVIMSNRGFTCRRVDRHCMWWRWDDIPTNGNEAFLQDLAETPSSSSDGGMVQERQETNERMTQERDALWTAVQKSVELRKEIKSAQERLLVEIADLIHSTYGQTPAASPREPETQSEVD